MPFTEISIQRCDFRCLLRGKTIPTNSHCTFVTFMQNDRAHVDVRYRRQKCPRPLALIHYAPLMQGLVNHIMYGLCIFILYTGTRRREVDRECRFLSYYSEHKLELPAKCLSHTHCFSAHIQQYSISCPQLFSYS